MTTISAEVLTHSIYEPTGIEAVTFKVHFPRIILAELNTHKMLSKNSSSSRAIPVEKMIESLRRDPYVPIHWGKNQKGMQADAELGYKTQAELESLWLSQMEDSIKTVEIMLDKGLHKQVANRLLEPWSHMTTVITGTQFNNLFGLREHKDAQPEFHALAKAMREAKEVSTPKSLTLGEWHLPYVDDCDWVQIAAELPYSEQLELLKKVSAARCARTSYQTFDGKRSTPEADLKLFEQLLVSQPVHASPAEHQCTPDIITGYRSTKNGTYPIWSEPEMHGNLVGMKQFRKQIPNEYIPG